MIYILDSDLMNAIIDTYLRLKIRVELWGGGGIFFIISMNRLFVYYTKSESESF